MATRWKPIAPGSRDQRGLFDPPANASHGSRAAATHARQAAPRQRDLVMAFVRSRGEHGATNDEIADGLRLPIQSVCARANELAAVDQIHDSGQERPTNTGRPGRVWIATIFHRKVP
jgi:hypothetical protein